jgi:hypothetical protein
MIHFEISTVEKHHGEDNNKRTADVTSRPSMDSKTLECAYATRRVTTSVPESDLRLIARTNVLLTTRPRAFAFPPFVASFGLVTRVLITSLLSRNAGGVHLQRVVQSFSASIN